MYTQVSSCPICGAPIVSPSTWMGVTPAPRLHLHHLLKTMQPASHTPQANTNSDEIHLLHCGYSTAIRDDPNYVKNMRDGKYIKD